MNTTYLPRHPVTGLRALGLTKRGAPIWPVLGGDGTGDGNTGDTRTAPTLTHSQSINRLKEINAELERLGELNELSAEDEQYFEELTREFDRTDGHRKRLERSAELARVRAASVGLTATSLRTERGSIGAAARGTAEYDRDAILEPDSIEDARFRNPWDLSEVRTFGRPQIEVATELRARALSAIEQMQSTNDDVRQAATRIIERFDSPDSKIARHALITSAPAYLRAWSKMARNRPQSLTPEEAAALDAAENFRAMTLTDNAGGYLVPFQLDPAVINTANGSRNDIRQAAKQVIATGDTWNGVSSASVSWSWDAEGSEVSDDAPSFGQPSIPIYTARGFVPITMEALADASNAAATVAELLSKGKDDLEAPAFITGSGSGQPTGIITALAGTSSEINAITDDVFALADVYALQGALPARYRANASWLANNLIYNKIRAFDTSGGGGFWTNLNDGRPPLLMNRPALEAEAMDGTLTTSGAVSNFILVFGDLSNYVIADRIGMTVEFIPHLFHTSNNLPNGKRGWMAHARMGADSVNDGGMRLLDMASAA